MKTAAIFLFFVFELSSSGAQNLDDRVLNMAELVAKQGYPIETHYVQTEDGYILRVYRIPNGVNSENETNGTKPVVFIQHGLLSSSVDFIITGPEKGLGYILADEGYDVWLGNARGNTESRRHVSLDPSDHAFWDFSWHEIGIYDLPAMIDYILEETQQPNLFYIGHSQGTTSFFVMGSERPEYNSKIRIMFALAPVAYMSHMTSPFLQVVSRFVDVQSVIFNLLGVNEFLPNTGFLRLVRQIPCENDLVAKLACSNVLFLLCGFDASEMNSTSLPVILAHSPAGSSTKQVVHYGQLTKSGFFRQYDHGLIGNLNVYNNIFPPNYDLSKVVAPVFLHWSTNDWLSAETDVYHLFEELGNPVRMFQVPYEAFNHLDYLWAIDVKTLLYDHIIDLLKANS